MLMLMTPIALLGELLCHDGRVRHPLGGLQRRHEFPWVIDRRGDQPVLTLVHGHHMSQVETCQGIDLLLLPAHGRGWVLMKEILATSYLPPIKGADEAKVETAFLQLLADVIGIHLLEVDAVIPNAECRARRRAHDPIRIGLADESTCQLPVRSQTEIPRCAVGLE